MSMVELLEQTALFLDKMWSNDGAEVGVFEDCLRDALLDAPTLDIYTASSVGDVELVADILTSLVDPEEQARLVLRRNVLGWNSLMYAVWQGDELLVRLLSRVLQVVGKDACVPSAGRLPRSGRTLLMIAARFGHLPVVRTLCKEEFLEARDFRGKTALHHAVRGAHEQIVAFLLEQGGDVNARDNGGITVLAASLRCGLATSSLERLLRDAGAVLTFEENLQPQKLLERDGSTDLAKILNRLSLGKYLSILHLHSVNLSTFLTLSEDDLKQMGVSLLGPRRKLALEISRLRSLLGMDASS